MIQIQADGKVARANAQKELAKIEQELKDKMLGIATKVAHTLKFAGIDLSEKVFKGAECVCVEPDEETVKGFKAYTEKYVKGLDCQKTAIKCL